MNRLLRCCTLLCPLGALCLLAIACGSEDKTASPAATSAAQTTQAETSNCPSPTGKAPEPQMKTYAQEPPLTIDAAKQYTATVKTVRGDFTIKLRPDIAPHHVNSFVFLARDHFFDGLKFHRVVPGFVIQGGDPAGNGTGGPGYKLKLEPGSVAFDRAVVGAARSQDPDSAGSQWFVTLGAAPNLNGQYTVFGQVTAGMDVVDCVAVGDQIVSVDIAEQ